MIDFLFVEWARSDSLLANETTTRTFKDNLILYLLLGLRAQPNGASAAADSGIRPRQC